MTSTMPSMPTSTAGLISRLIFLVVPLLHSRPSRFSLIRQTWRVNTGAGGNENILETEGTRSVV